MTALRDVMSTELIAVGPDGTVAEAAALMSMHQVGSVLVLDEGTLAGILTERDVVRALAADFDASRQVVVGWMTREPLTLGPDAEVAEALDMMLAGGFRHIPVVENERVLGMVSIRDLSREVEP
jgi:CBS domain-containing protein